jgi:hypothetical protein
MTLMQLFSFIIWVVLLITLVKKDESLKTLKVTVLAKQASKVKVILGTVMIMSAVVIKQ